MMKNLRQLLVLLVLNIAAAAVSAQEGGAYMISFEVGRGFQGNDIVSIGQDLPGNMLFANRKGVVIFDGVQSSLLPTGDLPQALCGPLNNGRVYIANSGSAGYYFIDKNGQNNYKKLGLYPETGKGETLEWLVGGNNGAYFASGRSIWFADSKDKITPVALPVKEPIYGLISDGNTAYVLTSGGLRKINGTSAAQLIAADSARFAEDYVIFSQVAAAGGILFGTASGNIYQLKNDRITELHHGMENWIAEHLLIDGKILPGNQLALASATGGVAIIDITTGNRTALYNTENGLSDNEVFALGVDRDGGLWLAQEFGIRRIDNRLPLKELTAYPGIEGNILTAGVINKTVVVGTTKGVFYLKRAENAAELSAALNTAKKEKERQKAQTQTAAKTDETPGTPADQVVELPLPADAGAAAKPAEPTPSGSGNRVDRIINIIKNKKNRILDKIDNKKENHNSDDVIQEENVQKVWSIREQSSRYLRQQSADASVSVSRTAEEVRYIFKKMPGIEGKCRKIISYSQGLLAATASGLYYITPALLPEQVIAGENISDIAVSGSNAFGVSESGLYRLSISGSQVSSTKVESLSSQNQNLRTLLLLDNGTLLAGALDKVLVKMPDNSGAQHERVIPLPNKVYEITELAKIGQSVVAINSGGAYRVNASAAAVSDLLKPSALQRTELEFILSPDRKNIWLKHGEGWSRLQEDGKLEDAGILGVFDDVKAVITTAGEEVLAISSDNRMFRMKRGLQMGTDNLVVNVKGVTNMAGEPFSLENLVVSYNNAAFEFRWFVPQYIKTNSNLYQYKIEGSSFNEWSAWSRQNTLKIELKPGSYRLLIRAKNALGQISAVRDFQFRVLPPFWQSWWFISIIVLLIAVIIWMVFKWRTRQLRERQIKLESMVKERTRELAEEKTKVEDLLLNILPRPVAKELQETGKAKVKRFEYASVLFTDFKDFTRISQGMPAETLVGELDDFFVHFDDIIGKYRIEKIKTIGDSYMCAAGLPDEKRNGVIAITLAAIDMLQYVKSLHDQGGKPWEIRIGIHTGPVVAGVVGKKKFAYDIWGQTVNTASRMESAGVPQTINVSETTYNMISEYFVCEQRGEVEAKNLGKMNMFFVKGIRPEYSAGGAGLAPNEKLLSLL